VGNEIRKTQCIGGVWYPRKLPLWAQDKDINVKLSLYIFIYIGRSKSDFSSRPEETPTLTSWCISNSILLMSTQIYHIPEDNYHAG
jgi:hypothetical protein